MSNKEIEQSIENLKHNIVFDMSLGAKELFHSNTWGWLFHYNLEYAKVFFKELDGKIEVCREDKHRDIVIKNNGKEFVIENKLKSVPYKEQLEKYRQDLEDRKVLGGCMLAGIEKPLFNVDEWNFISYDEIAKAFREINNKETNPELKIIVNKYVDSIEDIAIIMKGLGEINEIPHWRDYAGGLKQLRIWDLYQKYMASKFLNIVVPSNEFKALQEEVKKINENFYIHTSVAYHNGKDTIDFRIVQDIDEKYKWDFVFGIQIEDLQLRRIIKIVDDNKIKTYLEKHNGEYITKEQKDYALVNIFNIFKGFNWFEPYNKAKQIFGHQTSMSKEYCRYGSHEVYQYYNIEDASFDNVKNVVIGELQKVVNIFKEIVDDFKY